LADSGNTKFAVNIFDFYAHLFSHLQGLPYSLQDFEAAILIPLLCEKTALNNNILKEKVKKLIKMVFTIYGTQQTYNMIVQNGLTAKSLVAQAECLDEIADFI
jgi:cytoskeleton-associated protein 5